MKYEPLKITFKIDSRIIFCYFSIESRYFVSAFLIHNINLLMVDFSII